LRRRISSVYLPGNPGDAWNCADFAGQGNAQRWYDQYSPFHGDPAGLDSNADGVVCESLEAGQLVPALFSSGTYRIGLDLAVGTYRARSAVAGCIWNLKVGPGPPTGNNDVTSSHTIVTIDATDLEFSTSPECGTWSLNFSPTTPSPFGTLALDDSQDITLIVGIDIRPSTWTALPAGAPCEVELSIGFGGADTIADRAWCSESSSSLDYFEILQTDAAIHVSGCSRLCIVLFTQAITR